LLARCRTLRYVSNRLLHVVVLKSFLPRAFPQVALVSFLLPTCGDSRPELHVHHNNGTSAALRRRTTDMGQRSGMTPERPGGGAHGGRMMRRSAAVQRVDGP
jgi:hypothetical protein